MVGDEVERLCAVGEVGAGRVTALVETERGSLKK